MMLLRQYFDHDSFTYTYLIADTHTQEAVLLDPVSEHTEMYLRILRELSLNLISTIDTHTHADHISAMGALRQRTQCKTQIGAQATSECVDKKFQDKDIILIGSLSLQVIYTPGHTDDSYCFYIENDGKHYLFTGDTLLIRGTGRTDFQNGDALVQYHSLTKRLLTLPSDTIVLPGHDYNGCTRSTLLEEKSFNPRLQVCNGDEYKNIMDNLHLPNPKLMDIAIPANQACGEVYGEV